MYKARKTPSALSFVADMRYKSDVDLDEAEPRYAPHVLELNKDFKEAIGPAYLTAQRMALFNPRRAESSTSQEREKARAELLSALRTRDGCCVTVCVPTASMTDTREAQRAETICWGTFKAPDSLSNMRGCFFEYRPGTPTMPAKYVVPIHAPSPFLKELQRWENGLWIKRAESFARQLTADPLAKPLEPCTLYAGQTQGGNNNGLANALLQMRESGRPVAVDIESIEATGTITAIGMSDGLRAVSVNWEPFTPHGRTQREPGIRGDQPNIAMVTELVEDILASDTPKVFHNHTFDVPRLEEKGLRVGGVIEDSFAASAIAHPELRHGLQAACARYIPEPIPPWKSLWHPKLPGVNRDDVEFWTCDPAALYDYNARDAFYTWHLAAAVLPQVERKWFKPEGGIPAHLHHKEIKCDTQGM